MTDQSELLLKNIEALAGPEIHEGSDGTIIFDYKNKWLGLASGCKAKINHTCTVKDPTWPDIQ